MNKVILIGRLGADVALKGDGKIATLSVATSEYWKDKDGKKQDKTEWHRVVVFNEGIVRYVSQYGKKGRLVSVEGAIQTRKWNDQGVDKYVTEVVVQPYKGNVAFLDKGDQTSSSADEDFGNMDIPF